MNTTGNTYMFLFTTRIMTRELQRGLCKSDSDSLQRKVSERNFYDPLSNTPRNGSEKREHV